MQERVQGCLTAGVALVGAGVMVMSPVTPQAPEVRVAPGDAIELAAAQRYDTQTVPELFALSAERTVTGLAGTPIGLAAAVIALAQQDDAAARAILEEIVDGPLWAADPAIYALDDILPLIGGDPDNFTGERGDSVLTQFRYDVLFQAREGLRDALGAGEEAQPTGNEVGPAYAAARLAGGFAESAVRTAVGLAGAPLGLVAIAEAVANGDEEALYVAVRQYIDAPLYVADPVIFAVDDVLPAPYGGDPETNPAAANSSTVTQFRADVLWRTTDNVRTAVAGALDVNPNLDQDDLTTVNADRQSATVQRVATSETADVKAAPKSNRPVSRIVNSLKDSAEKANERASERREQRAERRDKVRSETKKAVSNLRDALKPKKRDTTTKTGTSAE